MTNDGVGKETCPCGMFHEDEAECLEAGIALCDARVRYSMCNKLITIHRSREDVMQRHSSMRIGGWLVGIALAACSVAYGQQPPGLDLEGIARAMGTKGEVIGETYKVSFPRSDLRVMVGKVRIKPALALSNWAA